MNICKLCLKEKPLVQAHIIPESLYAPMREDSRVPRIYSTEVGSFPKKVPTGVYDSGILCATCDRRIGDWDNYAQQVLLAPIESYGDPAELRHLGVFIIHNMDYERFKLFFISLLWRAHQSTHQFFQKVNLGSWATLAGTMILEGNPGEPDEFGVSLVRYEHPLAAGTIYNPEPLRSNGLNYYRFSLGSFVAMIKVDGRAHEGPPEEFLLRPGTELLVGLFEYEDSRIYHEISQRIRAGTFRLRGRNVEVRNRAGGR